MKHHTSKGNIHTLNEYVHTILHFMLINEKIKKKKK